MSAEPTLFKRLDFRGTDAATFLQGYLTADLDDLGTDRALPMALCNIKGRVIVSGWAFGEPSHVRLMVHESVAAEVERELGKYLLFAKAKLSVPESRLRFTREPIEGAVVVPNLGYAVEPDATVDEGHAAFAEACVEAGFVAISKPVTQTFLPQMVGLTDLDAVSFAKGCYLGQEVVARAQHRGEVKRRLRRYRCAGNPPMPGDDVVHEGAKIGTVVAAGRHEVLATTRGEFSPANAGGCQLVLSAAESSY